MHGNVITTITSQKLGSAMKIVNPLLQMKVQIHGGGGSSSSYLNPITWLAGLRHPPDLCLTQFLYSPSAGLWTNHSMPRACFSSSPHVGTKETGPTLAGVNP